MEDSTNINVSENQQSVPETVSAPKKSRKALIIALILLGVGVIGLCVFLSYQYLTKEKSEISTALIPVYNGEEWGFVNHQGKSVIEARFADAEYFKDGVARVVSADGYVGYINEKGEFAVPAQYIDGTSFSHDRAFVVEEGSYPICINKQGDKIFELPQAQGAGGFCEGLALFCVEKSEDAVLFGFVNEKGEVVVEPQFEVADNFSEGLAMAFSGDYCGFINKKGEFVVKPQFDLADMFSEGLAAVLKDNSWGFVNQKGELVVEPQFNDAGRFHNGLAAVQKADGKWGFINKKGEFVIPAEYQNVGDFTGEMTLAAKDEEHFGYLSAKGEFIEPKDYEPGTNFFDGMAIVRKGNLFGFINDKGEITAEPQFDNAYSPQYTASFFILTDYYDASVLEKNFLGDFSANAINGLRANATLGDLFEHPTYGEALQSSLTQYRASFIEPRAIDDEITLSSTDIFFAGKTYDYEENLLAEEFNRETPISYIEYHFTLNGLAKVRTSSIAGILSRKFAKLYSTQQKTKNLLFLDAFCKILDSKDFHFILLGYSGNLCLTVYFDAEAFKQAAQSVEDEVTNMFSAEMDDMDYFSDEE